MNEEARTNVLLLVSSPLSEDPVAVDRALESLTDALRGIKAPAAFTAMAAKPDAVASYLARKDRPRFAVLHYFGHGALPEDAPSGTLVFEDETGGPSFLDPQDLYETLNPTGSREPEFSLAVVMACHSESVAEAFAALRIPHIIAVEADETVYQRSAIAFFTRFYLTLFTGGTVREAFNAGRTAVAQHGELKRMGREVARREARKFKLLPPDGDHDRPIPGVAPGEGRVEVHPLPTLTDPPFHERPPRFVGRKDEMRDLLRILGQKRAVLIQGVSGVGKTELAKEVARWLTSRRRFEPQEVAFVHLAETHDVRGARAAIATTLGVSAEGLSEGEKGDAELANALPPHRLIILDEVEGLIQQGVAFRRLVEALLNSPARPAIIVTSQADLGSGHIPRYELKRLTPQAAVELFVSEANIAPEELARFSLSDLEELLGYVDRLPRAVVLIARVWRHTRSPDLTPLLEQLKKERDRIMRDPQYPDEVKSVTVGIQMAYERLKEHKPDAANLYPYLALFPGGIHYEGIGFVFGPQAIDYIADIESQGLAERPWPDLVYIPAPFRFFVERHLPEPEAAARARYGPAVLRFYVDLPEEPHSGLVSMLDEALVKAGELAPLAVARYVAELPSIEAWLDWALENAPCEDGHSRPAWLAALLENIYIIQNVLATPDVQERYRKALEHARRCGDRLGEANTLQAIGDVLQFQKQMPEALQHYRDALELFRRVGSRLGEANTLASLSRLALHRGEDEEARRLLEQAVEIHDAIGSRYDVAANLGNFGLELLRLGRPEEARGYLLKAAEIFEGIGLPQLTAQMRRAAEIANLLQAPEPAGG